MDDTKYICIDKYFGFKQDCDQDNSKLILKDDWINPANRQACVSLKTGDRFHTKTECDQAQLNRDDVYFYLDYEPPKYKPIKQKYDRLPEDRENSRKRVVGITFIIIVVLLLIYMVATVTPVHEQKARYLLIVALCVYILGFFIYIYCPFNLCTLEPSYSEIRTDPISWSRQQFIKKPKCST